MHLATLAGSITAKGSRRPILECPSQHRPYKSKHLSFKPEAAFYKTPATRLLELVGFLGLDSSVRRDLAAEFWPALVARLRVKKDGALCSSIWSCAWRAVPVASWTGVSGGLAPPGSA